MRLLLLTALMLLVTAALLRGQDATFANRADAMISDYSHGDKFWGTVLVARQGEVVFKKAYGMADLGWNVPNTISSKYEIASLTKAFTAIAVVQLAAQGKLRLEDSIAKYDSAAPAAWKNITIEELLTHTSGLPNNDLKDYPKGINVPYTPEELIATFRDRPLSFAPGTKWAYTNTEYYFLALVIEKLSGESYANYLAHHIFDPLGMHDSGFAPISAVLANLAEGYARDEGRLRHRDCFDRSLELGAGGVHSTVDDLFIWNEALYTDKLVPTSYMKQVFSPHKPGAYGFGWFVTGTADDPRVWHEGSDPGYAAFIIRRPTERLFIVVLSNLENAPVRDIAGRLETLALGR